MTVSAEAERWLGRRVQVYAACDPRGNYPPVAEGVVVGYAAAPTITVRADDGTQSDWQVTLPIHVVAEQAQPAERRDVVQELADAEWTLARVRALVTEHPEDAVPQVALEDLRAALGLGSEQPSQPMVQLVDPHDRLLVAPGVSVEWVGPWQEDVVRVSRPGEEQVYHLAAEVYATGPASWFAGQLRAAAR